MNRYLLAGSAVVALALGAGSANAQGKFEVRMGGDAVFEAHFLDQDRDNNARGSEFADRFRLNITAMAKADNGLEYGGRIRLRSMAGTGGSNTTDVDRAYLQIGGSFGKVKLGTTNSYSDDDGSIYWPIAFQTGPLLLNNQGVLSAGALNPTATGTTNSATATNAAQVTAITTVLAQYSNTDNQNASKIVYASPRFSGFQLGASYTPRTGSSGYDVSRSDTDNALSDVWELGLNYGGEFSGVGIKASVGYMGGSYADSGVAAASQREEYGAWQGGLSVSYAGFTVGGGYLNKGDSGQLKYTGNQDDYVSWGVGAQYATGPLTVGVSFTRGEGVVNPRTGAVLTGVNVTGGRYTGTVEQDQWAVGALYAVAPGLVVGAEYNYIDADAPGTAYDDKANVFILRSALIF